MKPREIKRLRGRLIATQKQFGELIHANAALVCYWERGRRVPSDWHVEIMDTIRRGVNARPAAADEAKNLFDNGMVVEALAVLLSAAVPGALDV